MLGTPRNPWPEAEAVVELSQSEAAAWRSAGQLERLQTHLQCLRFFKSRERLEALLPEATAKEVKS